ncbi:hypothetical protein EVAR_99127_1 [Eumeta japonica]|uniref:Uncharacterized protein n=1 Tax=Eumeta variegata TaxID=151549 RepID=A0A4C1YN33_EUMVA|nr:hypothetical protein EVAR_99127_1 [Eumeta japonica]
MPRIIKANITQLTFLSRLSTILPLDRHPIAYNREIYRNNRRAGGYTLREKNDYLSLSSCNKSSSARHSVRVAAPLPSSAFNFAKFKRERRSFEGEASTGRPLTSETQENIQANEKLIQENRRFTCTELEEGLGIRSAAMQTTIHDHLYLRSVVRHSSGPLLTTHVPLVSDDDAPLHEPPTEKIIRSDCTDHSTITWSYESSRRTGGSNWMRCGRIAKFCGRRPGAPRLRYDKICPFDGEIFMVLPR